MADKPISGSKQVLRNAGLGDHVAHQDEHWYDREVIG